MDDETARRFSDAEEEFERRLNQLKITLIIVLGAALVALIAFIVLISTLTTGE